MERVVADAIEHLAHAIDLLADVSERQEQPEALT